MKSILYITLLYTFAIACTRYPTGVEETLSLAGSNRSELEKVLRHYQTNPADSLKYKAACFLIDNMKWHLSTEQAVFPDSSIYKWHTRIDNLYEYATDNLRDSMLNLEEYAERNWYFRFTANKLIQAIPIDTPTIRKGVFPDTRYISSAFLVRHIENAFKVWHESPHASSLPFDQFKELILPYRAITGYPFFENGKRLNDMFKKWLDRSSSKNINGFILRYSHYKDFIRMSFMNDTQKQHVGIYDLFLGFKGDCISVANNACNVFRACGIPIAIDYNISFREKTGRHFHGKFLTDTGNQILFNEVACIDSIYPLSVASPSFFRNTFGAQMDSPYMLKAEGEYLPDYFDTPCLKEVTGEYYQVARVSLPFNKDIPNHLAFLYTFDNTHVGLAPATWGKIDRQQKQVTFENVVYHTLYIPCYLRKDSIIPFASPFYIIPKDTLGGTFQIIEITPGYATPKGTLVITRKFPEKPYLQERAKHMIGGRFEGANREDFADSILLYTIRETPILNLQDYIPVVCRPFRHYRYVAPDEHPRSNMGMIQFLTDEYTPEDSLNPAIPLPVFSPKDSREKTEQQSYMRLCPDIIKYPNQRWSPVSSTSMLIYSFSSSNELSLKRPMKVKKIRITPVNAENHIVTGHRYQLYYWDNGWKNAGSKIARYNYLQFDNVPQGCLYWLRNLSTGNEELPFFYRDGKQLFIYHDTIVPSEAFLRHYKDATRSK